MRFQFVFIFVAVVFAKAKNDPTSEALLVSLVVQGRARRGRRGPVETWLCYRIIDLNFIFKNIEKELAKCMELLPMEACMRDVFASDNFVFSAWNWPNHNLWFITLYWMIQKGFYLIHFDKDRVFSCHLNFSLMTDQWEFDLELLNGMISNHWFSRYKLAYKRRFEANYMCIEAFLKNSWTPFLL